MSNAEPHTMEPAGSLTSTGRPIGSLSNFVLACVGLLSLLADEIPSLLEQSVQRGGTVVEQAHTAVRRQRAAVSEGAPQAGDEWQSTLSRRGLATHRDFETLLQQVTELEQQIDRIAAQRSAAP